MTQARLSKFTVDPSTLRVDPASELVLISQRDEHLWHNGGSMFFHPEDGFLYLSNGDEGSVDCRYQNCQHIDKDLFSGVLRIDVDMRGGDVSHPIPRQPADGTTAHYYIPNDNPFVGQSGVLEEFYALGLRSPHKMSYDPIDKIAWIGDVGQEAHEELNVLSKGANFQWDVMEGTVLAPKGPGVIPPTIIGDWTDPVVQFDRADSRSVIGGYVYRGERMPELQGKYIYGDYITGNIWAISYEYDGENATVLSNDLLLQSNFRGNDSGIVAFATDEDAELYVLTAGTESKIQRLRKVAETKVNLPATLSESGLFKDLETLEPLDALIPYDVNVPLWSDGAKKTRWASIPSSEVIQFAADGPWTFPAGSVFVKHFEMALDERQPEELTRLETRVLVKGRDERLYGVTYKWREDGTDADLLVESLLEDVEITDGGGNVRLQRYFYPGPGDCLTCHNASAGRILGVNTAQLNGEFFYENTGRVGHQLTTWQRAGLFAHRNDWQRTDQYPALAPLSDTTRSHEDRVRSYWAANCGMCHGVQEDIKAEWDARYSTPLEKQGVINGELIGSNAPDGAAVVVPGDPQHSVLYLRDASTDQADRMPPLGRSRADQDYLEVLEAWILSLSSPEKE